MERKRPPRSPSQKTLAKIQGMKFLFRKSPIHLWNQVARDMGYPERHHLFWGKLMNGVNEKEFVEVSRRYNELRGNEFALDIYLMLKVGDG